MYEPLVVTATPTLFQADESIDRPAVTAHLQWLREKGVDGVFPAGTTGEFPALTDAERLQLLEAALGVFGPDNVYLHVGAASARQAVELARNAVAAGARRLAAVTPYFQPAPADQVVAYYEQVAAAAGDAFVYGYVYEARTTTHSEPTLAPRLASLGLAGMKVSGEPEESVGRYLAAAPAGFEIFCGNDIASDYLFRHRGRGIVSGVSAAYPEPFVALRDAHKAADETAVAATTTQVKTAVDLVRAGSLTHLKAAITARGFAGGPVRSAVAPVSDDDLNAITAHTV